MSLATSRFSLFESRARAALAALPEFISDPAHDLGHVERVVRNARWLAEAEGADLDVVLPAAWLHDCYPVSKSDPRRAESSRLSATRARDWLAEWGYLRGAQDHGLSEKIEEAIRCHSFSAGLKFGDVPKSIEAKVVQDADRLEALGAVGLARCFVTGGAMGRRMWSEADPFCEARKPDDATSTLDHFYTKLLTLAPSFQTESARGEARVRTQFLKDYLEQLRREIS